MTVQLYTGAAMPLIGLGLWKSKSEEVEVAIKSALSVGYRHFDSAMVYGNEKEVGLALKSAMKEMKTSSVLLIRFQVQRKVVAIPKSVNPGRIAENFQVFDFTLDEQDFNTIKSSLPKWRVCVAAKKGPDNKPIVGEDGRPVPRDADHPFYAH
ncbi:aldo-keto reductase family 1 member A1-like [Anneissia japonica]|uniref:aldo-keto reductase family 1 member A1-like n=1 Tax=Anneissia japonica TaxID=1529436 RepID=UPI0014259A8A|nr:aldo-keto reductase family 1 member A1-like [Anneissia japonica]